MLRGMVLGASGQVLVSGQPRGMALVSEPLAVVLRLHGMVCVILVLVMMSCLEIHAR